MTLLTLFQLFIDDQLSQGKNRSVTKSLWARQLTEKYLASLKREDISVKELTIEFIERFYYFVQEKPHNYSESSARNACYALKSTMKFGIMENLVTMRNPFDAFIFGPASNQTKFLSIVDIVDLENAVLPSKELEEVRDLYLLCCLTGLTYSGLKKFHLNCTLMKDEDDNYYLSIKYTSGRNNGRQPVMVPLVETALEILKKYEFKLPKRNFDGDKALFKKIAKAANLETELTVALARSTFTAYMIQYDLMDIAEVVQLVGQRSGITNMPLSSIPLRTIKSAHVIAAESFRSAREAAQLKNTGF